LKDMIAFIEHNQSSKTLLKRSKNYGNFVF